jgi:hypothetical protein
VGSAFDSSQYYEEWSDTPFPSIDSLMFRDNVFRYLTDQHVVGTDGHRVFWGDYNRLNQDGSHQVFSSHAVNFLAIRVGSGSYTFDLGSNVKGGASGNVALNSPGWSMVVGEYPEDYYPDIAQAGHFDGANGSLVVTGQGTMTGPELGLGSEPFNYLFQYTGQAFPTGSLRITNNANLNFGNCFVGMSGMGSLIVENGGQLTSNNRGIWISNYNQQIYSVPYPADTRTSTVNVRSGGAIHAAAILVGGNPPGTGSAIGRGNLEVGPGGSVSVKELFVPAISSISLHGFGSSTTSTYTEVGTGLGSNSTAQISDGAVLTSPYLRVGGSDGQGAATISTNALVNTATLIVGGTDAASVGSLAVKNGGKLLASFPTADYPAQIAVLTNDTLDISQGGIVVVGNGTQMSGAVSVGTGGTLLGDGNVIGDVAVSGGTLNPGEAYFNTSIPLGVLSVTGDVRVKSGSMTFDIGGTTPGDGYSQLQATKAVHVGGTLNIRFVNGFTPTSGMTFNLINAKKVHGKFGAVVLPGGLTGTFHHGTLTIN